MADSVAAMDFMPGEKLIWAGHPTWRATISWHFDL
jgi:hypothetical protein